MGAQCAKPSSAADDSKNPSYTPTKDEMDRKSLFASIQEKEKEFQSKIQLEGSFKLIEFLPKNVGEGNLKFTIKYGDMEQSWSETGSGILQKSKGFSIEYLINDQSQKVNLHFHTTAYCRCHSNGFF